MTVNYGHQEEGTIKKGNSHAVENLNIVLNQTVHSQRLLHDGIKTKALLVKFTAF